MYGMPMPSSGLATLTMALNMLEEVAPEKEVCGQNADSIALALNALRYIIINSIYHRRERE